MNQSPYLDALSLEHFKSAIVVVPLLLVVCNIAVIYVVIDSLRSFVGVGFLRLLVPISPLEVVPQSRVAIVLDGLKLPIGIEAKHRAEDIVNEAEDGIGEGELVHARVAG